MLQDIFEGNVFKDGDTVASNGGHVCTQIIRNIPSTHVRQCVVSKYGEMEGEGSSWR